MAEASNNKQNCRKHAQRGEEREREWKGCEGRASSFSSPSFLIHISSVL
jgi:hypothetical protein